MNGWVKDSEMTGVVGKKGVDGVKEYGEHLVDMCPDRGLLLTNISQHGMIHRCTWRRDERGEQKCVISYIAVDDKLRMS